MLERGKNCIKNLIQNLKVKQSDPKNDISHSWKKKKLKMKHSKNTANVWKPNWNGCRASFENISFETQYHYWWQISKSYYFAKFLIPKQKPLSSFINDTSTEKKTKSVIKKMSIAVIRLGIVNKKKKGARHRQEKQFCG